jgi:hypothetical protein
MVGLKYKGKKKSLIYKGENITCGIMQWGKSGQVIQVPIEDAEEMVNTSPTDFEIVKSKDDIPEEPIAVIEKEDEPELEPEIEPEKEDALSCSHEGCDFVAKAPHGLVMHTNRKHPKPITPIVEPE